MEAGHISHFIPSKNSGEIAALKFCFKTCVAMKFVDDDDDDDEIGAISESVCHDRATGSACRSGN